MGLVRIDEDTVDEIDNRFGTPVVQLLGEIGNEEKVRRREAVEMQVREGNVWNRKVDLEASEQSKRGVSLWGSSEVTPLSSISASEFDWI